MKRERCVGLRCREPIVVYILGTPYCQKHNAERLELAERVAKLPRVCRRCGTEHSILVSCPEAMR